MSFTLGFGLSLLIAVPAFIKKSLTLSGAIAAIVFGTLLFGLGGAVVYFSLIAFFISSSVLSKLAKKYAAETMKAVTALLEKNDVRDHTQAIANAGVALICAILYNWTHESAFKIASVMAFAVANADTWASEIGVLSQSRPVYLLKRTPVERGISGGVTWLGSFASLLGAAFIAVLYVLIELTMGYDLIPTLIAGGFIVLIGFLGSLIDSIIGELWQAKYLNAKGEVTERHHEGRLTHELVSGYKKIDNNVVNFVSGLMATAIGIGVLFSVGL